MNAVASDKPWRTLTGDCRLTLPELPALSIHTCVTSPPYWGLQFGYFNGDEKYAK